MHLVLGMPQSRWIEKLMKKKGIGKAALMKEALYDLAVKEGIVLEVAHEVARDAGRSGPRER